MPSWNLKTAPGHVGLGTQLYYLSSHLDFSARGTAARVGESHCPRPVQPSDISWSYGLTDGPSSFRAETRWVAQFGCWANSHQKRLPSNERMIGGTGSDPPSYVET